MKQNVVGKWASLESGSETMTVSVLATTYIGKNCTQIQVIMILHAQVYIIIPSVKCLINECACVYICTIYINKYQRHCTISTEDSYS